ncbi:hypothetical protein ACEPAG_450 [Sanghuangporus baumii]
MWRAQAQRSAASASASRSRTSLNLNHNTSSKVSHCDVSEPNRSSVDLLQSAQELPIVRWFRGESSSPSQTSPPSTPPSALREALEDGFPGSPASIYSSVSHPELQRPPPACLPVHMNGRLQVRRSPPFLESLARSTLPTASVTRPPPVFRQLSGNSHTVSEGGFDGCRLDATTSYIDITQSPPTRTSVDSLRQLRDRGIPVAPNLETPSYARLFSTTSPTRWWFGKEHKTEVDELLDESDRADTIEGEEEHLRKKYLAPKHPVVFCHGLLGFDNVKIGPSIAPMNVSHWRGIKEVLEARGIEVLVTRVPATSSPMERAKVLEARVSEVYPGRAVHLIGHSMGGLDCRYLTTHLTHRKFDVLSITTVATPHRGSSFADHFIATVGKERLPSVVSLLDLLPNGGGNGKAFESLTIEAMRKFNEETPDVEGVQYFSWGAIFEPGLFDVFKWSHSVIMEKEGPNDGLVSVYSSRWGTYLGTLEDVNHLDLIGWMNTARYKWAEFTGREIKFKPATFYLGVADHLARHAEGQGANELDNESSGTGSKNTRQSEETTAPVAESSRAGAGVKTTEGVENRGPRTPDDTPSPTRTSDHVS